MGNAPTGLHGLLAELKRRRVFRVAAAYVVVAFALLQAADIVFPALGLPTWTMTLVVVLAILGFPAAVALGWAFDITSDGIVRTADADAAAGRPANRRGTWARPAVATLVVAALAGAGWLGWQRLVSSPDGPELDTGLLAVVPFRVAGAEPSLAYLREGMLDLVAAKLTGETGPRAVDPRTLTSAWRRSAGPDGGDLSREEALLLARSLGAGRLVLGEVISLPGQIVLSASLSDVASGRTDAPVSVEGPPESLPDLVDRLVAGLLSIGAGERERLASLTTTSLPALRLYLEGQADYRSGRYDAALNRFNAAVATDTTFALAALMMSRAAFWIQEPERAGAALDQAWRHRERLGARDRALLAAQAGPRYPGWSPADERIRAWESIVRERPDSPDAWFEWGDALLHWGTMVGVPDSLALDRSADAFSRALALDSLYLPALGHLFDVASIRGDTAGARRFGGLYLDRDPVGLTADAIRSLRAAQTRGAAALPEIIARADSAGGALRRYTIFLLAHHWSTVPLAAAVAEHFGLQTANPEVVRDAGIAVYTIAMNTGRTAGSAAYLQAMVRADRVTATGLLANTVRAGLFWDGDGAAAARAASDLAESVARSSPEAGDPSALCALGQWQLARGGEAGATDAAALAERLRGNADASQAGMAALHCAELLDTWSAAARGAPDAAARIVRLDSLLATGQGGRIMHEGNLVLARLLEERGDAAGALRVLGRYELYSRAVREYSSTFMRERGRLAAQTGDTATAVDAYRWYLAMRFDPEERLRPDAERVRSELEGMTRAQSR